MISSFLVGLIAVLFFCSVIAEKDYKVGKGIKLRAKESGTYSNFLYSFFKKSVYNGKIFLEFETCGHADGTSGCYGGGGLGPFENPCAIARSGNYTYVLDLAEKSGNVSISAYYLIDSTNPYNNTRLIKTLLIPEYANTTGKCHLAALGDFAYFGLDSNHVYGKLNVQTATYEPLTLDYEQKTDAITASSNTVIISQSNSQSGSMYVYDSFGFGLIDGGEFSINFMINHNGYILN